MPTLEKSLVEFGLVQSEIQVSLLLVYFDGLGGDLNSILRRTTTLHELPARSSLSCFLRFVFCDLFQNQIGKICCLASGIGISWVENGVFFVAGHKFVEHIQIIWVNLLLGR